MKRYTLTSLVLASLIAISGCEKTGSDASPYELAVDSYNDQNHVESLLHLKRAIQIDPNDKQARKLMAQVLIKLDDPVEAEHHIRKAIELGINKNELLVPLGIALVKQKKYKALLDEIKFEGNLLSIGSEEHAKVYALQGQALLAEHDFDQSLAKFKQAISLDNNCVRAYVGLAGLSFAKKDIEQANHHLQAAFDINPDSVDAWFLKGDIERLQGHLGEAIKAYTNVIDNSSRISFTNQYAHLYRAMAELYKKDFDNAWDDIKKVEKLSGENLFVDYVSGLIAFHQEDYGKAQNFFEKVLSQQSDHNLAHFFLGASHFLQGHAEVARNHIVYFLNDNSDHEMAQKMLAMIELNLGDTKSAQKRLAYLLEKNPEDSSVLNLLGQFYIKEGDLQKGAAYLERSVENNPESFQAQLRYGISQIELGDYQIADEALAKAIKLGGQNKQVAEFYRLASYLKSDPQKVIDYAATLLKEDEKNVMARNFKAAALVALQKRESARSQFEQTLSYEPGDPTANFNLANMAYSNGDKSKAKEHLTTVVDHHPKLVRGYLKLAQLEMQEDNLKGAEQWLQKALLADENHVQSSLALSKLYATQKRVPDALNVLTKLDSKGQSHPGVLLAMTELYIKNAQYALAQQTLASFEISYPKLKNSEDYLSVRAALYAKVRQHDRAAKVYQQLLKNYPNSRWVIELASNQWADSERTKAIHTLRDWVNTHPQDNLAQLALANYYLINEDTSKAIDAFERANEMMPKNALVLNNLAWLLQDKDTERAYQLAEQAVEISPDLQGVQHTLKVISQKRGVVR